MRKMGPVILTLLIFLSGCAGFLAPPTETPSPTQTTDSVMTSPTPTPTPSPTATPMATLTPTATPTPTPTPTPEPPDNPWKKDPVIVSINNTSNPDRDLTQEVNASLEFWERHGQNYSYYDINYTLVPNATSSDIEVTLVDKLQMCGDTHHLERNYLGCASNLTEGSTPADTEVVRILSERTDAATTETIKHEFGHLHGLGHDDEPQPLMNETSEIRYKSKKDAVSKSNPWKSDNLYVYLDMSDVSEYDHADTREQIKHALDYYSHGADGHVPDSISLQLTNNESRKDITIEVIDSHDADGSSYYEMYGEDVDTDDNLEAYTEGHITIDEIPTEHRGWHAGYWLAAMFGKASTDEFPPPFDDPDHDDREHWW